MVMTEKIVLKNKIEAISFSATWYSTAKMTSIEAVGIASVSTASRVVSFSMPRRSMSPPLAAGIAMSRAMTEEGYLLQSWIDQREIRFRIKTLLHRYRIDGDHYFQRWRYIGIENMAGTRCSV